MLRKVIGFKYNKMDNKQRTNYENTKAYLHTKSNNFMFNDNEILIVENTLKVWIIFW